MIKKAESLSDILDRIVIYGGENGDEEWTLKEIETDAQWDITRMVVNYLKELKVDVPKPVFGSSEAIKAAARNSAIEELILIIEEGE